MAKLSLAPVGDVAELTDRQVEGGYSAMRDAIAEWFAVRGATYDLRVQLQTDPEAMPVEDAAVLWGDEPLSSSHRRDAAL